MLKFRKVGECLADKIDDKTVIRVASDKQTYVTLKKIAIKNETSVAEMIRVMINDFLSSYEQASD